MSQGRLESTGCKVLMAELLVSLHHTCAIAKLLRTHDRDTGNYSQAVQGAGCLGVTCRQLKSQHMPCLCR